MPDQRVSNLAKILVQYSVKVQPKDRVAILGGAVADPLIREVYREVLRAGGYPETMVRLDGFDQIYFTESNDDQLQSIPRLVEVIYSEFNGMVSIMSETNTRNLSKIDPSLQSKTAKARTPLFETYLSRAAAKEFKWVLTMFPTDAYAQDAEMSLVDFEDYVYATTFADSDDPVAEWTAIHDEQQRLIEWLKGKKEVVMKGPNIDMQLSIEDRTFENADGEHNMPSGEIFTGPVEESVEGWVNFTYPAVTAGREVEGVHLEFKEGRVVEASAEKNEEFLLTQLDTDEGARYLGEWAIGTNRRIDRYIKNILFDEKIGGTIHMALGKGYPETGSKNNSAIHWDMICDMSDGGQILVDGELFYESGKFSI
jgi:aminopeptidase